MSGKVEYNIFAMFIYFKDSDRETVEKQIFHLLVQPSNIYNSEGWSSPKTEARNSV